jgi:hypothetical protein
MNFLVPQFIDEKPKIVGFLTLQQFGILAGGGIVCYLAWTFFTMVVAIFITLVIGGLSVATALGKVNGQSVFSVLVAAAKHAWNPRTYTWQRKFAETTLDTSGVEKIEAMRRTIGIESKLKSLALAVTTGKIFSGLTQPRAKEEKDERERFQVVSYLTGEKKVAKRIDYK